GYPQQKNKPVAEAMYENIKNVGLPTWSEEDQTLAKALQKELGNPRIEGLATRLRGPRAPPADRGETGRGDGRAETGSREHRRRLGRHRRRVGDRADRDAALSVEHPRAAGTQLVER